MGKRARLKKQRVTRRHDTQALVQLYGRIAASILPNHFNTRCCLNGTRVALEVFKHFKVPAVPVVTRTAAFNELMFRRFIAEPDADAATVDRWVTEGGWSVGVGPNTEGPGWNGHLIAIAADLIVDSSASQFCRIMKGIEAEPIIIHPVACGFGNGRATIIQNEASGTVIWYMPELGRRDYRGVPGFQRSPWNLRVAKEVIAVMEAAV